MTVHSLAALLAPRTVAIVGASSNPASLSSRARLQLRRHGFQGEVFLVNPRYTFIDDEPCYDSLTQISQIVDVVLVFVAAERVVDAVWDAVRARAQCVIVFSSGFSEAGVEGSVMQAELHRAASEGGIRILGPNCLGVVDFRAPFVASWTPAVLVEHLPTPCSIAYVGQSGAVGGTFFDLARQRGVVPSVWVSTGNQVDITATEVASHLVDERAVDLVCLYLEQVPDGRSWDQLTLTAAEAGIALAVLRSGCSKSGVRAAKSHTGALMPSTPGFELMCRERNVIVVDDINELVDVAVGTRGAISRGGRALGIVTTSGGAGGLAADLADANKLSVEEFSAGIQRQLGELVPSFGAVGNPVDVTAQLISQEPTDFVRVCEVAAASGEIDQLLIVLTNIAGPLADSMARSIGVLRQQAAVPISVAYLAAQDRTTEPRAILAAAEVAVFDSLASAVRTIALLSMRSPSRLRRAAVSLTADLSLPSGDVLTEWAGSPLLDRLGIARPVGRMAQTRAEAEALATSMLEPYVLKVQSALLLHKSDHGAVCVGVAASELGATFDLLMSRVAHLAPESVQGILVQELARPGIELLVGVSGSEFGYPPVVTVGMGGRFVEVYSDVSSALAPLSRDDARALLGKLRGSTILDGGRGTDPVDLDAAAAAIEAISQLAVALGDELSELEINPLIVHNGSGGATAVDLLVRRKIPTAH
ncbi:MAG: acetate--CoA ligase family protein [Actinomycetota bacterium]